MNDLDLHADQAIELANSHKNTTPQHQAGNRVWQGFMNTLFFVAAGMIGVPAVMFWMEFGLNGGLYGA